MTVQSEQPTTDLRARLRAALEPRRSDNCAEDILDRVRALLVEPTHPGVNVDNPAPGHVEQAERALDEVEEWEAVTPAQAQAEASLHGEIETLRAERYRLHEACLTLAAPLCWATDGTTGSVIRHITGYVETLEAKVAAAEEQPRLLVDPEDLTDLIRALTTRGHTTGHTTGGLDHAQDLLRRIAERETR